MFPGSFGYDALIKTDLKPVATATSEAQGIVQSDTIIRVALLAAIEELRQYPYLLDFVFNTLKNDPLTNRVLGAKEVEAAKRWFLGNEIMVKMDYVMQPPTMAAVSIALVDSAQDASTLADVHYEPVEALQATWAPLAGPFAAEAYEPETGLVRLPPGPAAAVFVVPGMTLVDDAGTAHPIVAVGLDRADVYVAAGTVLSLTRAFLKGAKPRLVQGVGSAVFRETYRIGCHVVGDPGQLLWLHSIVVWCLLAKGQTLLEARGFERATVSSQPFAKDERWPGAEQMWTRSLSITGYVRQSWPVGLNEALTFAAPDDSPDGLLAERPNRTGATFGGPPGQADPEWAAALTDEPADE